jgi:hypothetical protein
MQPSIFWRGGLTDGGMRKRSVETKLGGFEFSGGAWKKPFRARVLMMSGWKDPTAFWKAI